MKKLFILLPAIGALCYFGLQGSASGPGLTGDGDRTGATGSPGCGGGGCHSSPPSSSVGVTIVLYDATGTTPVSPVQYVPGTSYKLRLTGNNSGSTTLSKYGFQIATVLTSTPTTNAGTLSTAGSTHTGTYTGIKIVEHSSALSVTTGSGGSGSTYVIDIPWTAPTAGTGSVTAYAVMNLVNNNTSADVGDLWNNSSLAIPEGTSSGVSPITGTTSVCVLATTPLSDATAGGVWSSSNTSIATVNSSGLVGGVAAGTATISYVVGSTGTATTTVTVNTVPTPAAISGATLVCVGTHIIMSDATSGGVWSSAATTIATAASGGIVSGVAIGTTTITYSVTNGCGTGTATKSVTVKALGGTCVSGVAANAPMVTKLNLFPNPNTGSFTISLSSDEQLDASVVITDLVGARVAEFSTKTNKDNEVRIDRPAGMYYVTMRTSRGVYSTPVVVQ